MLFHPNLITPPYTALLGSTEATPGETQTPTVTPVDAEGRDPDPHASLCDPVSGSSSHPTSLRGRQCSPVRGQQESYLLAKASGAFHR